MANNPDIQVEIGANITGLQQGVAKAESTLQQVGNAANQAAPKVQKLANATQNYNSVGVDFARIIQDAPFGIIGVGNNITQLAGSFQAARNSGASFGKILSGIFSSGNLLILGISALTTVFTILQQKGFFKTEEAAKSLDDQLKEYQETLKGVAAASLKGAQDAQKEVASLTALRLQVENTNISQKDRLAAVEELQKEYPSYFGNLTKEQILNGQVGDAYKLVTESLLAKAKAQASINKIAENSIKLLTVETKLEELKSKRLLETSNAQAQIDALIQKRNRDGFLTQQDIARYDELVRRLNEANKSQGEEVTLLTEKKDILTENQSLEGLINQQLEKGVSLVKSGNVAKEESIKLEDELISRLELANKIREDAQKKLQQIAPTLLPSQNNGIKDINIGLDGPPVIEIPDFDDSKATQFLNKTREFSNEASSILEQAIENSIGNFAFSVGFAIGSGADVLKAAGATLLGGIADIADALGQSAIKIGVGMIAIKLAFKNPFTAIAAGAGLIALAGFLRTKVGGITSGIGGPSGGGGVGSAGISGVGSGTSFAGSGATAGTFNRDLNLVGEFTIRGNDLVYVIDRSKERLNKG